MLLATVSVLQQGTWTVVIDMFTVQL